MYYTLTPQTESIFNPASWWTIPLACIAIFYIFKKKDWDGLNRYLGVVSVIFFFVYFQQPSHKPENNQVKGNVLDIRDGEILVSIRGNKAIIDVDSDRKVFPNYIDLYENSKKESWFN